MAVSSALVLTRPIIPATVYALTNKYNWTKQDLDPTGGTALNHAASSASGSNLIVSLRDFDGGEPDQDSASLFVSSDYGATWHNVVEAADPGVINEWRSVDISNNGQTMVALSGAGYDLEAGEGQQNIPGKIVISHNAGVSWSDITAGIPIQGGESSIVVSGDGSTIAMSQNGDVYISGDGGSHWTNPTVPIDVWAASVSISDDGDKLLVGHGGSGSEFDSVYISEDGGTSWTDIDLPTADPLFFASTAISADGSKMAVAGVSIGEGEGGENDHVFVSENDGETWTDVTPDDGAWNVWTSIDMSDDGRNLAVFGVVYNEGGENMPTSMYVSGDSGTNWTEEDPGERETGSFYDNIYLGADLDLNSDGSRAIIARTGGVFTGNLIGSAGSTVNLIDPHGGKTITLTTPEGTTITCHAAVKEAGLLAADNAYAYPLGLVDFCFNTESETNEVSLTFVTDLKPNQVKARKYNSINRTYFDIPNATITQTTHQGQPALRLTYAIADNGPLDLDAAVGSIKDPVGLAVVEQLANTGQAQTALLLLATLLTGTAATAGLLISPTRRTTAKIALKK